MRKTIHIRGMSCRHCVMAVTRALEDMEGVENVTVNLERGEASFDETRPVDRETLRQRVEDAGYELD